MTAIEIVDALLEAETSRYLTVFGPGLPSTGLVVRTQPGKDPFETLLAQYQHLIPTRNGVPVNRQIEELIRKRYIFALSDPAEPGINLYTNEIRQRLPDDAIDVLQRVFGIRPSTPVYWFSHVEAKPNQTFADVAVYGEKSDEAGPQRGYPKMKEYSIGSVSRPEPASKPTLKTPSRFMHTIGRGPGVKLARRAKMTAPGVHQ